MSKETKNTSRYKETAKEIMEKAREAAKEAAGKAKVSAIEAAGKAKVSAKEAAGKAKVSAKEVASKAKVSAIEATDKAKVSLDKAKDSLAVAKDATIAKLDADGDGQVGIEDVIVLALKTPGVYINRAAFLKRQLFKNHPQEVIEKAINTTPALAGISSEEIDKIADESIISERTKVSGISAALGAPGGLAMAATIPADIIQYYGFTLRAIQKLLYLYGFPEIDAGDAEGLQLDEQTMNTIVLCLGTMYGVAGANNAIKAVARGLANGVNKKLMGMALTKGTIFPFVREVSKWFGVRLTKSMFSGAISKAIPVVGGVIGGGLTFVSFKPCCDRLKKELKDTLLANPEHKASDEEMKVYNSILEKDIIEADFSEIEENSQDN